MSTWIVSRHKGAIDWLALQGLQPDQTVPHLDPEKVSFGDIVVGTLPIHLAAEICSRGARYLHLSLNCPYECRGMELTALQLQEIGAEIREYAILPLGNAQVDYGRAPSHE